MGFMKALIISFLFATTCVQGEFYTLYVDNMDGATRLSDEIKIKENEVLKFQQRIWDHNSNLPYEMRIIKGDFHINFQGWISSDDLKAIKGPATFRLYLAPDEGRTGKALVTVEITNQLTPPDKTVVIPAGTSAVVKFEKSVDLVNWELAEPGTFTPEGDHHLFFRIVAEKPAISD